MKKVTDSNYSDWGAEAIIVHKKWFGFDVVDKIRIPKSYRIEQLDIKLRQKRTIMEAKLLIAARQQAKVSTPFIFNIDVINTTLTMEFIEGHKVEEILQTMKMKETDQLSILKRIGKEVGRLHNSEIIHGDLTTSNIILNDNKLYFIDFGLGKFSNAVEDKAVDVLLIKKCLQSSHAKYSSSLFLAFQEGYKENMSQWDTVLKRAKKVEARGRHLKEDKLKDYYLI